MKTLSSVVLSLTFALAMGSVTLQPAVGGDHNDASEFRNSWNAPGMRTDQKHSNFSTCIGNSAYVKNTSSCASWPDDYVKQKNHTLSNRGTETYRGAILMLMARQINANGAYFCPTQIEPDCTKGSRGNKAKSWTEYFDIGEAKRCFWLCKDGFHGENCVSGAATTCNATAISQEGFKNLKRINSGANIEYDVPTLYWAYKKDHHECDMILVVSQWIDSGHGAWVQPAISCSEHDNKHRDFGFCVPRIEFVGTPTLMCMDGYRKNTDGTDCEPVDGTKCALSQTCAGWSSAEFKTGEHETYQNGDCFEYRCQRAGYGFVSATDRNCKKCDVDAHYGLMPKEGICVECSTGEIFDKDAPNTGYCSKAIQLSTTTLRFGPSKNQYTEPLNTQCWLQLEPTTYRECVTTAGWTPTTE